jgi:hypothetical protein
MTTKKVIKLISLGAAVLMFVSLSVSADPTNEEREAYDGKNIERLYDDLPANEDPLIAPTPETDNLVAPEPGAEGDVFILENDNLVRPDEDAEGDVFILEDEENPDNLVAPETGAKGDVFILDSQDTDEGKEESNLLRFSVFTVCVAIGLLGCVYLYGKRQG